MIIGNGFVICTPKKCGTHTLNAIVNGTVITPWHRTLWPESEAQKERILAVRDPEERYISMYHFLRKVKSGWGKRMADVGFREWAEWYLEHRHENPDWGYTFLQIAEKFRPHWLLDVTRPGPPRCWSLKDPGGSVPLETLVGGLRRREVPKLNKAARALNNEELWALAGEKTRDQFGTLTDLDRLFISEIIA